MHLGTPVRRNIRAAALAAGIFILSVAVAVAGGGEVEKEFINSSRGFSNVAVYTANGVKTIYVAGQVGIAEGSTDPGDNLSEQAEIAFANLLRHLKAAGAGKEDLIKTTVFIKDIDPEKVQAVGRAQAKVLALDPAPVSTWVGVTGLVYPSLLVEIEGIAVMAAD